MSCLILDRTNGGCDMGIRRELAVPYEGPLRIIELCGPCCIFLLMENSIAYPLNPKPNITLYYPYGTPIYLEFSPMHALSKLHGVSDRNMILQVTSLRRKSLPCPACMVTSQNIGTFIDWAPKMVPLISGNPISSCNCNYP